MWKVPSLGRARRPQSGFQSEAEREKIRCVEKNRKKTGEK